MKCCEKLHMMTECVIPNVSTCGLHVQAMSDTLTADTKDLQSQIGGVQEQLKALKAKLYSKFGNSIQLCVCLNS